jgi:hypothetical protein
VPELDTQVATLRAALADGIDGVRLVAKNLFKHRKARYRGMDKNVTQLGMGRSF